MADTRAAMREFRFLDDKRKQGSLSAAEEGRWTELRTALGIQDAAAYADPAQAYAQPQQAGYYAEDGNWYPYPQEYAAAAPQPGYPEQYPQGYPQQAYPQQAYPQ